MAKKTTKKAATSRRKSPSRPGTARAKSAPKNEVLAVPETRVRERAYEISLARTGPADPVADWFQAKQEIESEMHVS